MFAHTPAKQRIRSFMGRIFSTSRRRRSVVVGGLLIAAVGAAAGVTLAASSGDQSPPPLTFETQGSAQAMASAFSGPQVGVGVPSSVTADITAVATSPETASDPPGDILAGEGRTLMASAGTKSRAVYGFPTSTGGVCYVITGVAQGCQHAFPVDEPATIAGDTLYPPSQNGPVSEIAGLTEDGVTRVQVVVDGTPHDALMGNDAWYYEFPDSETPPQAASQLLVTTGDGSTVAVATDFPTLN
jgi:hypothetical protein